MLIVKSNGQFCMGGKEAIPAALRHYMLREAVQGLKASPLETALGGFGGPDFTVEHIIDRTDKSKDQGVWTLLAMGRSTKRPRPKTQACVHLKACSVSVCRQAMAHGRAASCGSDRKFTMGGAA